MLLAPAPLRGEGANSPKRRAPLPRKSAWTGQTPHQPLSPADLSRRPPRILAECAGVLVEDVVAHPGEEGVALAGNGVPGLVEGVGALVVAMGVGRVGAAGHFGDGGHRPAGQDHGVGAAGAEIVDHFLDRDDRPPGGEHRFLLHPEDALDQHVAVPVGAERVDDRYVRADCRHGCQHLPGIGTGERADRGVHAGKVDALVAPENGKGQIGGAGLIGVGHRGVGMLLERERRRPVVLHRVAHAVQRSDAGIAAPGKDQPVGGAHADQLIVDQIRGHADERQVLPALADHLMAGGERDEMGEAFHGHRVAVAQIGGDGVGEGEELSHGGGLLLQPIFGTPEGCEESRRCRWPRHSPLRHSGESRNPLRRQWHDERRRNGSRLSPG